MIHNSILKFRVFFKDYCLFFSTAAVAFFFFLSRYPFFAFTPIAEITTEDSMEYYGIVLEFLSGKSKIDFGFISPGYPLFLYLIGLICNTTLAVIVAQNIIALASGIFLIYTIYRCYGSYAYLISFCLCGYFSSELNIDTDSLVLPDSIYTSLLISFCSFLILAFKKNRVEHWFSLSLVSILLILIRSSGIIILPIMLLVIFYMIYNNYEKKKIATLVAPILVFMLLLSIYNYFSIGLFTFLTSKRSYNISDTHTIISEDEQKFINEIVSFLPENNALKISSDSYNMIAIHSSYQKIRFGTELYFDSLNNLILHYKFGETENIDSIINKNDTNYITYKEELKNKIGSEKRDIKIKASKLKFLIVNFIAYINLYRRTDYDFYGYKYGWRYYFYLVNRTQNKPFIYYPLTDLHEGKLIEDNLRIFSFKELINYNPKTENDFQNLKSNRNSTLIYKLYDSFNRLIRDKFFNNYFWILLFGVAFIFGAYKNIHLLFRDADTFLLLLLSCLFLCSAFLFALSTVILPRYSFTTEFIYYLSAVFFIICLTKKKISKKNI